MHTATLPADTTRWAITLRWLGEVWCGLCGGHDWMPVREPASLHLQCAHCGRRTAGIVVG